MTEHSKEKEKTETSNTEKMANQQEKTPNDKSDKRAQQRKKNRNMKHGADNKST